MHDVDDADQAEGLRVGKDTDYQLTVALESIIRRLATLPPEKRPRILFLQMDNAPSECKNRFMIAFACWLVHMRIFTEVVFGFLLVGHTHEDVDQMFSQFSRWLSMNNVLTFQQFLAGVGLQYHNKRVREMAAKASMSAADIEAKCTTRVFEVEHVLGVKKWIRDHINPKLRLIQVTGSVTSIRYRIAQYDIICVLYTISYVMCIHSCRTTRRCASSGILQVTMKSASRGGSGVLLSGDLFYGRWTVFPRDCLLL